MVATTAFVAVSITDTVLLLMFATYTRAPSGVTATPMGPSPTGTVATTVGTLAPAAFVTQAITDTVLLCSLVTYACDPSGLTATPWGSSPTAGTVATTVFVAMSRTDTSLLRSFGMYANGAALAPAVPVRTTTPASHSAGRSPVIRVPLLLLSNLFPAIRA